MSIAPSQILYLEHGSSRLYAEAIQIVVPRRLCWARPTLLIRGLTEESPQARQQMIAAAATEAASETAAERSYAGLQLYDLKDAPDLIWPQTLFKIAYDVDFFALLVQLKINPDEVAQRSGPKQLNHFIRSFWQSEPRVFPPTQLASVVGKQDRQEKCSDEEIYIGKNVPSVLSTVDS